MPFAIDQEKLDSPDMKMLDIANPPLKHIQHENYPKMLYLHPKDKSKDHLTRVVKNEAERDAAMAEGWRLTPHVATSASLLVPAGFEADVPEPEATPEKRRTGIAAAASTMRG